MKKVLSILLVFVMVFSFCPTGFAVESLSEHICFTWAWDANKIDTDNSVTVVSWSGGSNSSYRSSFIVYDLPSDFTYESVKSEVILSFAINSATLNNGTTQAPTAAVVMVDGDKVKEAYNLKSGANATALLNGAKSSGVLLGTYKIGKYPRTSRIKNACVNDFFEKNPDVKSIGFYVTNLAHDGYSGTVNGIASGMTDFEVNFTAYNNYANTNVEMVDSEGNVLDAMSVRGSAGTAIDVPKTIDKDGLIWVRDTLESYYISSDIDTITVKYHLDKGDREKYIPLIENMVDELLKEPVSERIDLPAEYVADDNFVIEIEWVSSDESVVANDGTVYQGTKEQSAQIYAKVWIGEYTSVETKTFTVNVAPLNESETDENLIYSNNFSHEDGMRGNFEGEAVYIDACIENEFTISAFVRVDDVSKGGTVFNVSGVKCEIEDIAMPLTEGQWYHIAMTNTALYINGEKKCDITPAVTKEESFIGAYWGKMDNLYVYGKAFSQSVINNLYKEEYNSPEIEFVSASVVEGLDAVIVRVASKGYVGTGTAVAYADENARYSGYCTREIAEGVNVFSINVPNMGGGLTLDNTTVLLWDGMGTMVPLCDKYSADRKYDFGFDYTHPDNHMLSNTFTLMDAQRNLYLTADGLSQRTANASWTASFRNGVNKEGYYSLVNENGTVIDGNYTFVQVEGNIYKIKNADTGECISFGGNDEWTLNIVEYDDVSKVFASEGFFCLDENERQKLYSVTGQALNESVARREKLKEIINADYYLLDGESQAQMLREIFTYYPAYQINRAVNKSTTGVEASYTLSDINWTNYTDMEGYSKSGYKASVVYEYAEGDVEVEIFARSQNVVRNIAKGFSFMPYQFIKPLNRVTDYYATNNQFKAETGEIFIETSYEVSWDNVAVTGAHELGHLIDFAGYRISLGDYKTARDSECTVSGYGDTALGEDFAEFCQFIISCSGDSEQLRQLRAMYPGRFDAVCKGMCEMYGECLLK